jgi:hypothetical protein
VREWVAPALEAPESEAPELAVLVLEEQELGAPV